jgi:hypothetical protein
LERQRQVREDVIPPHWINTKPIFHGDWQYDTVHNRVTHYTAEFGIDVAKPNAGPQARFIDDSNAAVTAVTATGHNITVNSSCPSLGPWPTSSGCDWYVPNKKVIKHAKISQDGRRNTDITGLQARLRLHHVLVKQQNTAVMYPKRDVPALDKGIAFEPCDCGKAYPTILMNANKALLCRKRIWDLSIRLWASRRRTVP